MSRSAKPKHKILIADDGAANRDLLRQTLEPEGYDTFLVPSGEIALKVARTARPDAILLDVKMPNGIDGFETCRRLKLDHATADIPVIFISVDDEVSSLVRGFEAGGVDYITKPFRKEEILMRVGTHVRLNRLTVELREKNQALLEEIARRERAETEREQARDALFKTGEQLTLISEQEAARWGIAGFVSRSPTIARILDNVRRLQAAGTTSVLILGESGTGKELVARAIHFGGNRARGPFIPVNCSAIPRDLAESFLFGHVKGAFTSATQSRKGYFELADYGTLFLDEIGEMPLEIQAKLLRVLEEGSVIPVGGAEAKRVNVRMLAATNRNLQTRIRHGAFREDLYFRLARFTVSIPPLRERPEDIPPLTEHFLRSFASEMGHSIPRISAQALDALRSYSFPGNVRELKNILEHALIECMGATIEPKHLQFMPSGSDEPPSLAQPQTQPGASALTSVEANESDRDTNSTSPLARSSEAPKLESETIRTAVEQTGGDREAAARTLGLSSVEVYRRLLFDPHTTQPLEPRNDEERILAWVKKRGSITNSECRDFLGVDIHRASYLLNKLHQAGLLIRKGEHRWARYAME